MQITIIWTLIAVAAIVAEMMTGTIYLLVFGAAAALAAVASGLGLAFAPQCLLAALVAVVGTLSVRRFRPRAAAPMPGDAQGVAEVVSAEADGRLRVRWRGTEWDAVLPAGSEPPSAARPGDQLRVTGRQGNTVTVARQA